MQGAKASLPSRHSKLTPAVGEVKEKLALASAVTSGGPAVIVVSGCSGSGVAVAVAVGVAVAVSDGKTVGSGVAGEGGAGAEGCGAGVAVTVEPPRRGSCWSPCSP